MAPRLRFRQFHSTSPAPARGVSRSLQDAGRNGSSCRESRPTLHISPKQRSVTSSSVRSGRMISRYREAVAPAYLFLCLLLGGSGQGIWENMVLQLLGLAIIAWAAWLGAGHRVAQPARHLLLIALAAIALVALQMVPWPPAIWTRLGGREVIAEGYRILGMGAPWLPISVTPDRTLDALL